MDLILLQPGDPKIFDGTHDWKDGGSLIDPELLGPGVNIGQCLELVSVHQGLKLQTTSDVSNSQRTSGRPTVTDFTCVKHVDETSVRLYEHCLKAEPLGTGPDMPTRIYVLRSPADKVATLMTLTLRDALVTSIEFQSDANDIPTERLTLSFTEVLWHFTRHDADAPKSDGSISSGWSIARNRAIGELTPSST